jgi:hypothetical protein
MIEIIMSLGVSPDNRTDQNPPHLRSDKDKVKGPRKPSPIKGKLSANDHLWFICYEGVRLGAFGASK